MNLAQRFESLASRWQVFVAQQTYDPASSQCTGIRLPSTLVKGKSRPVPVYSIRGICSDNDTMLLAIPVTILSSTFANPIHGFLSAWQKSKNLLSVLLPLECNLKENDFLVCEFDCPECSNTMKVSGFTKTIFDPTADYPYCKEIKISCTEKTEGITFFQAGTLIESNKTWKEMSRH